MLSAGRMVARAMRSRRSHAYSTPRPAQALAARRSPVRALSSDLQLDNESVYVRRFI